MCIGLRPLPRCRWSRGSLLCQAGIKFLQGVIDLTIVWLLLIIISYRFQGSEHFNFKHRASMNGRAVDVNAFRMVSYCESYTHPGSARPCNSWCFLQANSRPNKVIQLKAELDFLTLMIYVKCDRYDLSGKQDAMMISEFWNAIISKFLTRLKDTRVPLLPIV